MIQDIRSAWTPAAMRSWAPLRSPQSSDGGTAVSASTASRDVSASLSITTKEGDTFSIAANFDTTATYAGLRAPGQRASAWSVSANDQFSVSMHGDFSAQELKDISRVVRTFLHDLRSMLKGHDPSVANLGNVDPATLKTVSATASASTTFAVTAGVAHAAPSEPDTQPVPVVAATPLA